MIALTFQTSVFAVKETKMSEGINLGYINHLLSMPKQNWPKPNKRMGHPGVPEHIEEMVEKQRQYRFEMIMDIPPFTFLVLVKNRRLPWM